MLKPLNDKVYDVIKWIALLVIPTLIGAIVAIAEVWTVPINEDIIAGLTGLSAAIGMLLTVSSSLYYITGRGGNVTIPSMPVQVYKTLQDITLYWLPAFATAYYVLGMFVRLYKVMPVVETAVIIQVFLGLILGIYSTQNGNLTDWVKGNLSDLLSKLVGLPGKPKE
jgi:ABC-type multidrug transport system permease subunit